MVRALLRWLRERRALHGIPRVTDEGVRYEVNAGRWVIEEDAKRLRRFIARDGEAWKQDEDE